MDYVEYPHELTRKAISVEHITKWVYEEYKEKVYDAVIAHSLGGIIALQLISKYHMNFKKIIYLDTNLKPAEQYYRNLMTPEHMKMYGNEIMAMFQKEKAFYTQELFHQIQETYDYTDLLQNINQTIYAIYGDRNQADYDRKIEDLNLPAEAIKKLDIRFIHDACHMIMVENPKALAAEITEILGE
jgi:esterase/lipase